MLKYISIVALAVLISGPGLASSVSFSGSILAVELDDGASKYTGINVGDVFSGQFTFGSTAGDATSTVIEGDGAEYTFLGGPYVATIGNGSVITLSNQSIIGIGNDVPISTEEANLLNSLFATSITGGTPFDEWAAYGLTDGAYIDTNDIFKNGIEFGIILFFNNANYADIEMRSSPPALSVVDAGIFYVQESDKLGARKFSAIGSLDSVSAVPETETIWLFCIGISGLLISTRRKLRSAG